mgnify:CR=1 FL=1
MRHISLLCVGKLKEAYWRDACAEYGKRLSAFCRLTVTEVEEERLPENFRKVLCWGEYFRYGDFNGMFVNYALGYQNNGSWGGEVANGTNARALAWMPLPEPPKEK